MPSCSDIFAIDVIPVLSACWLHTVVSRHSYVTLAAMIVSWWCHRHAALVIPSPTFQNCPFIIVKRWLRAAACSRNRSAAIMGRNVRLRQIAYSEHAEGLQNTPTETLLTWSSAIWRILATDMLGIELALPGQNWQRDGMSGYRQR